MVADWKNSSHHQTLAKLLKLIFVLAIEEREMFHWQKKRFTLCQTLKKIINKYIKQTKFTSVLHYALKDFVLYSGQNQNHAIYIFKTKQTNIQQTKKLDQINKQIHEQT